MPTRADSRRLRHRAANGLALVIVIVATCSSSFAEPTPPAPIYAPTLVTIHSTDSYAPDVVAEFSRLSGLRINVEHYEPALWPQGREATGSKGLWPRITVHADHEAPWSVLCKIIDATRADLGWSENRGYVLQRDFGRGTRYAACGPLLLKCGPIDRVPAGGSDARDRQVWVRCFWDARLDVVCHDSFSIPTVTDERGDTLLQQNLRENPSIFSEDLVEPIHETWTANGQGFRYRLPLQLPQKDAVHFAHFKGVVRIWVATKWQAITIDYPQTSNAAPTTATLADGHRITVFNAGPNAVNPAVNRDQAFARFDLSRDKLSNDQWLVYKHMVGAGQISIEDDHGVKWKCDDHRAGGDCNGLESSVIIAGEHDATVFYLYFRPSGGGPPARAIIKFPIATTQIDVPYDLPDVPLL